MDHLNYRNTYDGGELQPDQPHMITFYQDEPIHCYSAPTKGVLVERVQLKSSANDALRRLGKATITIEAAPQDRNDNQLYYVKMPISLGGVIRNDMVQPFLNPDHFVDLLAFNTKFVDRIDYWHYLIRYDGLILGEGEILEVTLKSVS